MGTRKKDNAPMSEAREEKNCSFIALSLKKAAIIIAGERATNRSETMKCVKKEEIRKKARRNSCSETRARAERKREKGGSMGFNDAA